MTQKLTRIGKIPIFLIDPIWLCLTSIQLIGMLLFFFIKELWVDLLNKNSKNGHFPTKNCPKMALYGQNSHFFYFDSIWLCLTSIQLIGMRLFFYIKELRVDLLNKTIKTAIFQPKMAQKWPVMAKIPIFFWSNIIMPYEYPVYWDALILCYQGTTSRFIE